ncbi:MAG: YdbL family protein [Kiloniellales bacterium]|jgi:uncharacterized protein YdbL (DUF1318 family)|nr:YdbL family protein [Kiloniellales bacterium]
MRRERATRPWRLGGLAFVVSLALALLAPAAMAQSLDELRASGAIGERYDGYVVVRDPSAAGAAKVAKEVNAKRKSLYEERAAAEGVTPADIGGVYAGEIMKQAPGGTWFLGANGNWRQK